MIVINKLSPTPMFTKILASILFIMTSKYYHGACVDDSTPLLCSSDFTPSRCLPNILWFLTRVRNYSRLSQATHLERCFKADCAAWKPHMP